MKFNSFETFEKIKDEIASALRDNSPVGLRLEPSETEGDDTFSASFKVFGEEIVTVKLRIKSEDEDGVYLEILPDYDGSSWETLEPYEMWRNIACIYYDRLVGLR